MKRTTEKLLQEGMEQIRNGTFAIEIDPKEIVVRDPKNLPKRLNALRRLNGLPPKENKPGKF